MFHAQMLPPCSIPITWHFFSLLIKNAFTLQVHMYLSTPIYPPLNFESLREQTNFSCEKIQEIAFIPAVKSALHNEYPPTTFIHALLTLPVSVTAFSPLWSWSPTSLNWTQDHHHHPREIPLSTFSSLLTHYFPPLLCFQLIYYCTCAHECKVQQEKVLLLITIHIPSHHPPPPPPPLRLSLWTSLLAWQTWNKHQPCILHDG